MTELRVYLPIEDLQPQFAAYLSSPTRARAYPPFRGQHSLIIEVAPALSIHRITDLALKVAPDMEPGILFTERQFGLLELHADSMEELDAAGRAILKGIGAKATDQLAPKVLYHDIIEDLSDQHAIILNRSRDGSILVPGVALLIYEMAPALFACVAANEAEKAAPGLTINDVQMMGATGRIFMSGSVEDMTIARDRISEILSTIEGRSS
ncbi:microcompartment protein [Notoacmeibacter marinus]|uniref:Microcompartment protein n=1 Tax=Notoacmeibacter marinus TaxID=1876515 RepID=A0A231UZ44_9HYPH|nr:microcompartment protein [Notoacmeibacter marinus]OXT00616.1 microcompartment protein [Notoacmeibacter marinus]